jgi:hypothetical protein
MIISRMTHVAAVILLTALLASCAVAPTSSGGSIAPGRTDPAATPSSELPSPVPLTTLEPSAEPSEEPTGELYALDCRGREPCRLAYLPDGGTDAPGWPVIVSGPCRGTATTGEVAYAACDTPDGVLVHAFDADATPLPGWPVRLPGVTASVYDNLFTIGCGDERSSLRIAGNGDLIVAVADADAARIFVLRPNGEPLPGWPRPFPGDPPAQDGVGGNGCRGFAVAATDDIVAWGYEGVEPDIELVAARTEFTVFGPDGRTRPGWPRGSTGATSRPVVGSDGSIWYVSATSKIWRHTADGAIAEGWPYQLKERSAPYLAPDGRLVLLLAGADGSDRAIALDADGDVARGWPVKLGRRLETSCLFGDTPCVGDIGPAFAPDGTTYVALGSGRRFGSEDTPDPGGSILAIEPDGDIATGWPVRLAKRTHALGLAVDDGGHLVVDSVTCDPGECTDKRTTLVFDAVGSPLKAGD